MPTIQDLQAMSIEELKTLKETKAKDDEFYIYCIEEIIKSKEQKLKEQLRPEEPK